jgi:hypothetical protein
MAFSSTGNYAKNNRIPYASTNHEAREAGCKDWAKNVGTDSPVHRRRIGESMTDWQSCFVCNTPAPVEMHHVFPQQWCTTELTVPLCEACHKRVTSGIGSDSIEFFSHLVKEIAALDTSPATRFWFLKAAEYATVALYHRNTVSERALDEAFPELDKARVPRPTLKVRS